MLRRRLSLLALVVAGIGLIAGPAWAHVTVDPGEATQGGFATVTFRVPNERDDAATTSLEVEFPADHPIPNASVQPVPGWTATVETAPAADGDEAGDAAGEAVTRITWTGGTIQPGEFQQFPVSMGPLPDDTDELVFPSIQTYDSGEVVRWIEEPSENGEEPENPAPVLRLVAGDGDGHGAGTEGDESDGSGSGSGADAAAAEAAGDDGDGDGTALAIVALVVGGLGLVVGGVAFVQARRRPAG